MTSLTDQINPTPAPPDPARAGWRTTEMYAPVVITILTAFLGSGLAPEGHWSIKVAGLVMAGLTATAYVHSRGKIKTATIEAKATTDAAAVTAGAVLPPAETTTDSDPPADPPPEFSDALKAMHDSLLTQIAAAVSEARSQPAHVTAPAKPAAKVTKIYLKGDPQP